MHGSIYPYPAKSASGKLSGDAGKLIFSTSPRQSRPLKEGEKIIITAEIGYAFVAGIPAQITAYVIPAAGKAPATLDGMVKLVSKPGPAARLVCVAEARPIIGKQGRLTVALVDHYGNPAADFAGTVRFEAGAEVGHLPSDYAFDAKDAGSHVFMVDFPTGKVTRIKALSDELAASQSNPVLPRTEAEPGIFFGILDARSRLSTNGAGEPAEIYGNGRRFGALDFMAMPDIIKPQDFTESLARADAASSDGMFVALHAIGLNAAGESWSILFGDDRIPAFPSGKKYGIREWVRSLSQKKFKALMIAEIPAGKPAPNFDAAGDTYPRLMGIELRRPIPSVKAQPTPLPPPPMPAPPKALYGNPNNAPISPRPGQKPQAALVQAKAKTQNTVAGKKPMADEGAPTTATAIAVLKEGEKLGLSGYSKLASPLPQLKPARTAVLAPALTRSAIFDALRERHCYVTTGAQIIMTFECNGKAMGSEIRAVDGMRKFKARAIGTAPVKQVDLLRNGEVVKTWQGNGSYDVPCDYETSNPIKWNEWWMLRVTQEDAETAYSSPIWVKK